MRQFNKIGLALVLLIIGFGIYWFWPLPPVAREITTYSQDWPLPNHDYGNTRTSLSAGINSGNISDLKLKWSFPVPGVGQWGAAATNPIIQGKNVYLQDLKSNLYVINLDNGQLIWKKEYNLDAYGPNGPMISRNRIFLTKGHYEVAALDMKGNELWSTRISHQDTVGVDIQPLEYDGMVYVSTVPGTENADFYSGGGMGIIYGLDYKTGQIKWSTNTVDSDQIWGNPQVNSGGGSWYPPAIDTNSGIMYWPVGNPAPWPGTADYPNGSSRPGPNLYTNSIMALKHDTGVMQWYRQVLPHDIMDLDLQISPILIKLNLDHGSTDVIIASGKLGKVYALDRSNGIPLWEVKVGKHLNDNLAEFPAGTTEVLPGPLGGVETPMAYQDGIIYVPVVDLPGQYTPTSFDGKSFDISKGKGELVALDAATGGIIWTQYFESMAMGAATVVNDLVFTSTMDGKIYAFNRSNGNKLWEYQAPGGINGWPAVAGNTIVFPVGLGPNPALLAFSI